MEGPRIDIAGWFQKEDVDVIAAEGCDRHVLILRKLPKPIKRFDGQQARLEVEYRELSKRMTDDRNENWVCVQNQEFTYWKRSEVPLADIAKGRTSLFDFFSIL